MNRFALLLTILLTPAAWAQWSIAPRTLENSKVYAYEIPKLKRDIAYKWVISVRGTANLIVRVSSSLGSVSSGYVRLDTIVIPTPGSTGFTDFTLTMTGDSLQNMLLPDDTGSLGTAGALLKAKDGWKGRLEVVTMVSGNGGILVVADGVGASYAPPPDDDTYAYTRWVATIDYVTPEQLSDSLDLIPRTASAGSAAAVADSLDRETSIGSRFARRIADSLALRALAMADSLARHYLRLGDSLAARYAQIQGWMIAQGYASIIALTDTLNSNTFRAPKTGADFPYGGGSRAVLTWLMEDSSLTRAGVWAGNYTWPGPYNDPTLAYGINMNDDNPHAAKIGTSVEMKYTNGGGYMSEYHLVFDAPGSAPAVRFFTGTGSWVDGRWTDIGMNTDLWYVRNGGGQSSVDDSTLLRARPPKNGSAGTFEIVRGTLDFPLAATLGDLIRVAGDSTAWKGALNWDSGSSTLTLGGAGSVSDYWRVENAQLRAGAAGVLAERERNRLTLSGHTVRLGQSAFGTAAKDSQSVASVNYVDTRIAAVSGGGISAAVLTDSLNANTVRAEVDPTATAKAQTVVRDTIDAKIPRTGIVVTARLSDSLTAALTGGARSISSAGRVFVSDDSITFVGEAGDVINAATGNVFRGTISANDTLSVTGMVDGQVVTVIITNAGTYTLGWTGVNWAGGTAPTLSAVANKRDVFTLIQAGGIVYGSYIQDLR